MSITVDVLELEAVAVDDVLAEQVMAGPRTAAVLEPSQPADPVAIDENLCSQMD